MSPRRLYGQTPNLDLQGYFVVHHPSNGYSNPSPVVRQNYSDETSWLSLSSPAYTLTSVQPNSHLQQLENYGGSCGQSPGSEVPQIQETSWTITTPRTSNADLEMDGMSDMQMGSLGSFDASNMGFSAANTATSSFSETYVFPMSSNFGTPANQLSGLEPPEGYHNIGQAFDASSPGVANPGSPFLDNLRFENDFVAVSPGWNNDMLLYGTEASQWSLEPLIAPHQTQQLQLQPQLQPQVQPQLQNQHNPAGLQQNPWDSQSNAYQHNTSSGGVAFEPIRGTPYQTHIARQEFLDVIQPNIQYRGADPVSPTSDNDGSWALMSNPASSYTPSHGSPFSQSSPPSHTPSPPQQEIEIHSHIFNSIPGPPMAKALRGRKRGLTDVEKKQARDVRDAKACWACHISKTKCSPCSPGRPCEQCARLAGKRRFCLFSCFNDPLESLSTFLVPSYLMGHFTIANVESFVTRNASSWGTQFMCIRMDWGYRKLLQADVVALALRSSSSEMGFHHQTVSSGSARPFLVRKASPPLGIPFAAMQEMQDSYARYVQDIVQSDVGMYLPTAYVDQQSDLPRHLLGAVANYYSAGKAAKNECELLRRALEVHVTSVILERSLFLDEESLHKVQDHLQQEYPRRSAPRCAQRQIKLALFLLQQRRIQMVLKEWGSMMWATLPSTTKDKDWAVAFGVFLTLILVMDKTLGAAFYFCEGRIQHHGYQASTEREAFQDLVRLTQQELFDRCKEIFHWKFKTRKGGREACNPIRDGMDAFQGKAKTTDHDILRFVTELQKVVGEFESDIRSHKSTDGDLESAYTDAGRLACIFLDDFLG
ncbi:uncharacterized protein L3040_006136 [Drepanopeziza brunnea f. sp. 'multigermtubi']|uniref:uncharacterized protein n=1 Tax=Drepanopeziza brunnea f. sp. 'multigermtubi' TaxID=698441 RepID=UPI002395A662|nr:hypothetical protein L3040_006136 [Drepanopeziza brunnea f. sp. 'multigermtubi']